MLFTQPANGIEVHRGGNRNQFIAHFVNLEPNYNEKHTFYVKYRHNGINDLCVIDIECLNETSDVDFRYFSFLDREVLSQKVTHSRNSTLDGSFEPTSVQLPYRSEVEYRCGIASKFLAMSNGTSELVSSLRFTCGIDGEWLENTTLPGCQCGKYSAVTTT